MVLIVVFLLIAGLLHGRLGADHHADADLPAAGPTNYGVDPVHFGLVFIIAATIGNFTPPVGAAMFVRADAAMPDRRIYPRIDAVPDRRQRAVTLLLIFVPEVVLIVPDLIFGKDMRWQHHRGGGARRVRQQNFADFR